MRGWDVRTIKASENTSVSSVKTRGAFLESTLAFLGEMDLTCLNDRDENQRTPNYTYRETGKRGQSIIDVICVSKGMFRTDYSSAGPL